jgi:hypothetical protein
VTIVARDGRTAAAAATRRIKPFFSLIDLTSPDEALAFVKKHDCQLYFAMCGGHLVSKRARDLLAWDRQRKARGASYADLECAVDARGNTLLHRQALRGGRNLVNLLNCGFPPLPNKDNQVYFELLTPVQRLQLLTHADLLLPDALKFHDYDLWFKMVEQGMPGGAADSPARRLFADLLDRVKRVVTPELAYFVRDKDGRVAMDVASKPVKQAIQEMLLWHGRYRVTDPQPEHASATCFVFKAIDDRDNKQVPF